MISPSWKIFAFSAGAYSVPGAELEERIERLLRVIDLGRKKEHGGATICPEECANYWRLVARLSTIRRLLFFDEPTARARPGSSAANLESSLRSEQRRKNDFRYNALHGRSGAVHRSRFYREWPVAGKSFPACFEVELSQLDLLEIDVEPLMPALVRLRDLA